MNNKMFTRATILPVVALLILTAGTVVAQDEGGGQSGADFLLSPSAPRSDAMGGVTDGQGDALEGMYFNPSVLMLDPNIQLSVGITPYPNGVTDASLAFGAPIGPGMLGVSAQLLSVGEFTYVSDQGQPTGSVTLFDAAANAGYAMYVWDHLSVGGSAQAVYRTLGGETAFGMGVDLGATWWFETPHVGQRPKPPTMEELEAQRDREVADIDSEQARRTREAAGDVQDLRDDVVKIEEDMAKIVEDISGAEEGEDTSGLVLELSEREGVLEDTQRQLADAEAAAADDLAAIEEWYRAAVSAAQTAHMARVADLREIETERARLFAVVDDPEAMLTPDVLEENIESAIARTREFQTSRSASLRAANTAFATSRQARITEIDAQIASYLDQISEIVGPEGDRIRADIERLEAQAAELEVSEDEGASDELKTVNSQIGDLQDQLDDLQGDAWVRRLQRRIDDKEDAKAALQADIDSFDSNTTAELESVAGRAERDIAEFEALGVSLQTDLRRAQLRRELDLIDARTERSIARAEARYEASEQSLYQALLAAMYENEERIFDSRIALANQDSTDRYFEAEATLLTQREAAEDEFAFQERLLTRQISDINSSEPVSESRLEAAQSELETLRDDYDVTITEIDDSLDTLQADEADRFKAQIAAIKQERQKVRLIYLQTDDPYRNTTVTLAIRNLGTNLKFDTEGYPMPRTAALGLSYGIVNTDMHSLRLSTEAEMPLYGTPTLGDLQVGVGLEYGFAGIVDVRAGYAFGSPDRNFSVGFGADFALGFTNYALDYTFRPIPDYGLLHSFGVAISL